MPSQIKFIRPKLLNNSIISSWFTLRNAHISGDGKIAGLNLGLNTSDNKQVVLQNRKRLLEELGLNEGQLAYGVQVHKTDVKTVKTGGMYPETDAFVSSTKNLALAIQVADCATLLFGDSKNEVIAAAHAGWRGAAGGIVKNTIHEMENSGAESKNIEVFIGPCISFQQFEVGEEVAVKFPDEFVDRVNFEKPHINLKAFLKSQLLEMGITENNIEIDDGCTISDEQFYSYRRQKESSGRMMGIIKLNT